MSDILTQLREIRDAEIAFIGGLEARTTKVTYANGADCSAYALEQANGRLAGVAAAIVMAKELGL